MESRLAREYDEINTSWIPAFKSYPYLVTLLIPSFHHIMLLPRTPNLKKLFWISMRQALKNKLECCLVLSENSCVYFDVNGVAELSSVIPKGAFVEIGALKLSTEFPESKELSRRQERLIQYMISNNGCESGYLIADPKKGGHAASEEELKELKGVSWNGVPKGLEQCNNCENWKGTCLDPNPLFESLVVKVECACANNNLCGKCDQVLFQFKLNANRYSKEDGQIWYTPGFCALHHNCIEPSSARRPLFYD